MGVLLVPAPGLCRFESDATDVTLHSPMRAMIACHTPHGVVVPTRSGFSDVRARDYGMKRGAGRRMQGAAPKKTGCKTFF